MTARLHEIAVRRTARYATLGEPSAATAELWLVCHGYGQLAADFVEEFTYLDDGRRYIVAPEGLSRFYKNPDPLRHREGGVGATWMTSEARLLEIDDYLCFLDALHAHVLQTLSAAGAHTPSLRVVLLGFSQGAATAARWAAREGAPAGELVLWGGLVPPDLDEAGRRRLGERTLTLVYGDRDQYATAKVIADQRARVAREGWRLRELTFPGGHRMDDGTLCEIAAAGGC